MFMPVMNPMADNAAFVGKTVRRNRIAAVALCCAVMMTSLLFGMLFCFNYNNSEFADSQFDIDSKSLLMAEFGMKMILPFAALIPAAIGSVNYLSSTNRSKPITLRHTVMTSARVFCGLFLFYCLTGLFSVITKLSGLVESSSYNKDFYGLLFMYALPLVLLSLWTISGFVFFTSAGKTLRGITVSAYGARFFRIMGFLIALMNIVLLVTYDINGFSGGLFYTSSSVINPGEIIKNNTVASVMFHVFFIASSAALIGIAGFAGDYVKAVKGAVNSLRMSGINMYMNGDSRAASFYGNFYTSPVQPGQNMSAQPAQPENDIPPQSVQPEYETVQTGQVQQNYNPVPQTVQTQQSFDPAPRPVQPEYDTVQPGQVQQNYNQPYNRPTGF